MMRDERRTRNRNPASRSNAVGLFAAFVACLGGCAGRPATAPTCAVATTSPSSAELGGKASTRASSSREVPDIVQVGAPVLRARASEVPEDQIATPEFQALVAQMIATMRRAPGVGLAAPQVGVPLRVIVLEDRAEALGKLTELERRERERVPFGARVFVNPVLREVGAGRATFFEGCLSVRGFAGLVERSLEVEVTGLDERGAPQTWRVRGWPARILQHEVDHLNGTLYVDRMRTRSFATSEHAKTLYGGKPIAEILESVGP